MDSTAWLAGVGIIPARAGFTSMTARPQVATTGSSPLARGLRAGADEGAAPQGIIPARAGFT